jgi:hypothetical protein
VVRAKSGVTLHFVNLREDWYVLQAREANGPAGYLLAEVRNRAATVYPLLCKDLADFHDSIATVSFVGEYCGIATGTDAKKLFTALIDIAGEPSFRLQILE